MRTKACLRACGGHGQCFVDISNGGSSEVIVIGKEDLTSSLSLLGRSAPPTECDMQIAGAGHNLLFSDLETAFLDTEEIRTRILEVVQQQTLAMSLNLRLQQAS